MHRLTPNNNNDKKMMKKKKEKKPSLKVDEEEGRPTTSGQQQTNNGNNNSNKQPPAVLKALPWAIAFALLMVMVGLKVVDMPTNASSAAASAYYNSWSPSEMIQQLPSRIASTASDASTATTTTSTKTTSTTNEKKHNITATKTEKEDDKKDDDSIDITTHNNKKNETKPWTPADGSSTATVMGFATGYGLTVLGIFVGSLRRVGFQGHIILGVKPDIPQEVEMYLQSQNVTIKKLTFVKCNTILIDNPDEIKDVHDEEVNTCVHPYPDLKSRWGRFPLLRDFLQECQVCNRHMHHSLFFK